MKKTTTKKTKKTTTTLSKEEKTRFENAAKAFCKDWADYSVAISVRGKEFTQGYLHNGTVIGFLEMVRFILENTSGNFIFCYTSKEGNTEFLAHGQPAEKFTLANFAQRLVTIDFDQHYSKTLMNIPKHLD